VVFDLLRKGDEMVKDDRPGSERVTDGGEGDSKEKSESLKEGSILISTEPGPGDAYCSQLKDWGICMIAVQK
jgi:hypothetical protein